MLSNMGVWSCQDYVQHKTAVFGRDPRQKQFVYHKREIMPDCVIELVRHWYPNVQGVEYMGHLWN